MKSFFSIFYAFILLFGGASFLYGAVPIAGQPTQGSSANLPSPTSYAITGQDGNSRVWERTTYALDPSGQAVTNVHRYTELATGLNHLVNGQWVESSEQIDILPNGTAVATNGQHQAYFPGDIYNGEIELVTPDGVQLHSRPMGLSYFDGTNSVLIAELTNSIGQVLGTNQVIYTNAFTDFAADLVYTYRKGGFEQDIVLREQPPAPATFGLNPNNTRLQVLTEFFDTADPAETALAVNPQDGLADNALTFGASKMIRGKAFLIGNSTPTVPVYKSWQHLDGRTFLVEELPLASIGAQLEQLPASANFATAGSQSALHKVSITRLLPPTRLIQTSTNTVQFARVDLKPQAGVVLDYVMLGSVVNNFTFRADTTYLMSGSSYFEIDGTATFEGGTVIKFAPTTAGFYLFYGSVLCQTGPYRPAIFTAQDDNTVGDTISGSTGTPSGYYGNGITIENGVSTILHDLRMSYLNDGFVMYVNSAEFDNIQAVNCATPIIHGFCSATINNGLFSNIGNVAVQSSGSGPITVTGTHLTIDNCITFADSSTPQLALTNCLITATTNLLAGSGTLTTNDVMILASRTGVYQSVGAGNYYLASGSSYRNAGTTNIDPALLADIQTKTTYPPILYSNVIVSTNTTLSPQAQRDIDTPDLGYHYDPIDYLVDNFDVTNALLTVTNGTAIATYNDSSCVWLQDGSSIVSVGSPLYPNWFVRYSSVQEQPISLGPLSPSAAVSINQYHLSAEEPTGYYRFTKFACPAGGGYHFYHTQSSWSYTNLLVQDCEFWGGGILVGGYSNTVATLKNNLFDRCTLSATTGSGSYLFLTNNLFWGDSLVSFRPAGSAGWYALNNAFDSCASIGSGAAGFINANNNAYFNCVGQLNPTNGTDIFSTNSLVYQTGPFGTFYQPTNSPLIHMGSTTADQVGLYHYTITTNEVIEGTNTVSIGYHYVATDAFGNPLDSNGDGIPDYLEDANGDGLVDNGETNWGISILTQPVSVTIAQGATTAFSVVAGGVAPLAYQWYFNSIAIANATNSTLTLNNIETNNVGNYFVVVTNSFGSISSSIASLMVIINPMLDSDYDGRNDNQEIADGTAPFDPGSVLQVRLAYFPFDDTNSWSGSAGQLPLMATNIVGVASWNTNAVLIDNTNGAVLQYRDVETNGNANINLRAGTVRFWFNPDWNSTTLLLSNATFAGSNFSFSITGLGGTAWNVYSSTNLTAWTNIGNVTLNSSGYGIFTDATASAVSSCFYQLSNSNYISQAIGFERIIVWPGAPGNPGTNALLANQLLAPANTLDGLFNPTMPDGTSLPVGTMVQKWNATVQAYTSCYTWTNNEWIDTNGNPSGNVTLNPGEGAFLSNPTNNLLTVTFAGLVPNGNLSIPLAAGQNNLVSSMVPQAGGLTTALGYAPNVGDVVQIWNGSNYNSCSYTNSSGGTNYWFPSEPVLNVGQAAFIEPSSNTVWQVNFGQSPSGSGGRFIEVGSQTSPDWWTLMLDLNGNFISLVTQTNGMGMNNLTAPINWTSNTWHQITLTYSTNSSALYVDGLLATNGLGTVYWPRLSIRTNGFTIGGSASGMNQARGVFDELETFNYPLDAQSVWTGYTNVQNLAIVQAPQSQSVMEGNAATFVVTAVGTGLTYQWKYNGTSIAGQTSRTLSLSNVTTNNAGSYSVTVANGLQSASASASLAVLHIAFPSPYNYFYFTVYGVTAGSKYDLYFKPGPGINSSANWRLYYLGDWGQSTMQFTLPSGSSGFFEIGSALDTDGDGLRDGYENLVSLTSPTSTDTDNDGLPDGWEALWGTNPTQNDATVDEDGDGYNNLYKYQHGIDPWIPSANPPRPLVTVTPVNGTFVITRTGGTSSSLTVNFTVGGTAVYGQDYTLTSSSAPSPGSSYPLSVTIPAGAPSVTLTPTSVPAGKTVLIGLIPCPVSDFPGGPSTWTYVAISSTGYGDTDGDGLADAMEAAFGCNPGIFDDLNNDGIPDWREDSDGDGLPDSYERMVGLNPNSAEPAPGLPAYSPNPVP